MAGELDGTGKVGGGFIDAGGKLKSKETLAKEDKAAAEAKQKEADAVATDVSDRSTSSALRKVSADFNKKAGAVLNDINEQQDNAARAKKIVKEEIEVAQTLKAALKDNDTEQADRAREQFMQLEKEREKLSKEIDKDNERVRTSEKVLNLGNKIQGVAKVPEVEFSKKAAEEEDLQSVKGVNEVLDGLKTERADLRDQQVELREAKNEAKSLINATEEDIAQVQDDSIRSLKKAEEMADRLAQAIRDAGPQAVLAQNVNASVVKSLLG